MIAIIFSLFLIFSIVGFSAGSLMFDLQLENNISDQTWNRIGETIKRFHAKNCNHADLNAHNILLCDNEDIYLIDFDKSMIDNSSGQWKDRNLKRLKRSLEKLSSNNEKFNYTDEAFSMLMQGYSA